ncbi:MAG: tyrosine-protein phosphatase [Desulfobulbaceae bacterium]
MIDIHCHILPALDDGPRSMDLSLAMAEIAVKDGIEVIIATPHADGTLITPARLDAAVRDLNRALSARHLPLTVVPGFELPHYLALDLAPTHTLAGSNHVLVEFPFDILPGDAPALISTLIGRGFQPVIAHPERNGEIIADPRLLTEMISAGAQVQMTAASITGELGPDCQRCAHYLLRRGLAHFIATDAHSPTFRTPVLSRACAVARKLLEPDRVALLVEGNPRKILSTTGPILSINPGTMRTGS